MKNWMLLALTTFSINAFSQSYMILENGVTLTTDKAGFVYDFGQFTMPSKVILKGGQFFAEEGGILTTVDETGHLFRKYEVIPSVVKGKGTNYFISDAGELYSFDRKGILTIAKDPAFLKTVNYGGVYFTVAGGEGPEATDIYAVAQDGKFTKLELKFIKPADIVSHGGNYFMSNRGVVFTISHEGKLSPQLDFRVGVIVKKGGNYFTDSTGTLYTVAEDGTLKLPGLPMSLTVSTITKFGSNYFLDQSGRLYLVDKNGNVSERSNRDNDLKTVTLISI